MTLDCKKVQLLFPVRKKDTQAVDKSDEGSCKSFTEFRYTPKECSLGVWTNWTKQLQVSSRTWMTQNSNVSNILQRSWFQPVCLKKSGYFPTDTLSCLSQKHKLAIFKLLRVPSMAYTKESGHLCSKWSVVGDPSQTTRPETSETFIKKSLQSAMLQTVGSGWA